MTQKIDYILDGLEIRANDQAVSLASGANPFAPRVSGGMTYRDFTVWNVWEQSNWQAGGLKAVHTDGGCLYASAETRYPNRVTLQGKPLFVEAVADAPTASDYAHLTEYNGNVWLGLGRTLYKWDATARIWQQQVVFTEPIRAIIEFAGFIFVGFGDAANAIAVDASSLDQVTTAVRASLFHLYNGLLYAAQANIVQYTNYETPVTWETVTVGGASEVVTGMASMMNDVLSSQVLYVSTQHKLYALLAGDVVGDVSPWPGVATVNGRAMVNHMGDVYASAGEGAVRITKNGDMIPMGLDLGAGLPVECSGSVLAFQSTLSYLHALVASPVADANTFSSVWSWSGEGWHQVMRCENGKRALGMYYARALNRLFVIQNDGSTLHLFLPDESSVMRRGINQRYVASGALDTCVFYGDLRNVEKMWGVVEIQGTFPAGTGVQVWWSTDETSPLSKSTWSINDVEWSYLTTITSNRQAISFPNIHSAGLRLRLVLQTSNDAVTPLVEAVIVRYIPRIVQQWNWQLTVALPTDCMFYRDGTPVEGYDQALWDMRLREICTSLAPVSFVDIDGREYSVTVTNFSRRISNVGMESCDVQGEMIGDITWSLNILQVSGNIL